MHKIEIDPFSSARTSASSARVWRSLSLVLSLALPVAAQAPRVVVSTTDDVLAGAAPFAFGDGELVAAGGTAGVRPYFMEGQFQATCGFAPTDIDAFTRRPGSGSGSAGSIAFSLLSNEGGFLDGDIIVLGSGGGATLLVSEVDIDNALGTPGAAIDVDALSYDDQGRVLFSLQTDLAGTVLGTVLDGDILRLELGFSTVTLVMGEAEVQTRFTAATGLADAILDVQAIEWAGGDLWAAVQSPSSQDGSVIKLSGSPQIVVDETAMGLGGAEIDALGEMRSGDEIPVFQMSLVDALPGDRIHVEAYGAPNSIQLVLMSGKTGYLDFSRFPGFGAWYLERTDPWLNATVAAHAVPFVMLDASGHFATDWNLPISTVFGAGFSGELGWSFQVLDVGRFELSSPLRVRKL